MRKINEARRALKALGLPTAQQNEMAALTLLALGGLGPKDAWVDARRHCVTLTKGIMEFVAVRYKRPYAPNTRETFRRHVLHQFVQARLADYNPDQPDLPTNSPKAHYALTEAALKVLRSYGSPKWEVEVKKFLASQGSLLQTYQKKVTRSLVPIRLSNGRTLSLSPGLHNQLQALVIEEFAPRFAPGSELLYLGDTAKKNLIVEAEMLAGLGVSVNEHDKLTDIALYDRQRHWLFLIEVVTSHGPMTPKRIVELEAMFGDCKAGRVFVSAFADLGAFRSHLREIAWETEVWIAELPDHMIHFNGDRFLGPR